MQHVCKQQIVEVESLRHFTNTSIYFTNTGITDFAVIDGSITTANNFILLYSLSLFNLHLTAIFPGGLRLAGARMSPLWILLDLR